MKIKTLLIHSVSRYRLFRPIFYHRDNSPKRCPYCGGTHFNAFVWDEINGVACEASITCSRCGEAVSYWAHGYYGPF